MAGPWEKYGATEAQTAEGPWSKYAGAADEQQSFALSEVPLAAVKSAPASAAKFAGDLYTAVTNPVQTVTGLADLAAGGLRAGAKAVLPESVFNIIDQIDNPETTQRISAAASAAGGMLADRYGSYEKIKRTIATDPVGAAADLSTLATGGAMATARVAPGVSNVLARTAAQTDPLMAAARAGVGGVNALRSVLPSPSQALQTAKSVIEPLTSPQNVAVNRIIGAEDPQAIANALRATRDMAVTPGAPAPTLSERMIAAGAPSLSIAGLETGVAKASAQAAQEVANLQFQRISAIRAQLDRVENQIQTQVNALAPSDLSQLKQVRDSLLRELADEQQTLANTAQVAAQPLPTVSQQTVGGAIQERGRAGARQLSTEVISPAYNRAFAADLPEPSIDLTAPLRSAERFVGDIGAVVDPTQVSPVVRNILRIEPIAAGAEAVPVAPIVSLEDFQSIRAALNKQLGAAAKTDPTRANGIRTVIRQMDAALEASPVPAEAKNLYREANRLVSDVQIPTFRTGETGKMLSQGAFNMPRTLPSQQVAAFLKSEEGAAQFVRTFQGDRNALSAMQQGVLDLYRRSVVDPATRAVDPRKAAAFEQKYARQLDTLEGAGLNVRETMGQVRDDAARVQQAMEALAGEAKKFGAAKSADEVVDLALKSPMDMRFVRDRLTPEARTALTDELVSRATTLIENKEPAKALEYLAKNERALKVGLGKDGAPKYEDLLGTARLQDQFIKLSAEVPKTDVVTPVTLSREFTAKELTDLKVVADDLRRMRQVQELGTPPDVAARRMASEQAAELGTKAADAPALFMPIYTAAKNAVRRLEERVNRKAVAAAIDLMIRDPDKLVPLLEKAAAAKKAPAPELRPLTVPVGRASGAAPLSVMGREENRNAMAR